MCPHIVWSYGCLCYADDVVLLAPSIDALHRMLHVCTSFAGDYGLRFNPTKTQFTRSLSHPPPNTPLIFGSVPLSFKDTVFHLGHILSPDLTDSADTIRATRDRVHKAFWCADSLVKTSISLLLIPLWCTPVAAIQQSFEVIGSFLQYDFTQDMAPST